MADIPFFIRGDIDLATAPDLRTRLLRTIEQNDDDLVVDCFDMTFLDCAGIRVLVEARDLLDERGRGFRMINVGGAPRRVLELLDLEHVLQVGARVRVAH